MLKIKIWLFSHSEEDIIKGIKFYIPDVIQLPINILDSSLYTNGTLRKLKDLNIEIQARSIFLQGLFYLPDKVIQKKFSDAVGVIDKLKAISNCHQLTLPELSFKWVNSLQEIDSLIIGIENADQFNLIFKLSKDVNNNIFDEALKINYSNIKVTNPQCGNKFMNKGQNLYRKAKIIPGGNQFLSKRPEMFLPDQWPAIIKKQKDAKFGI